MPLYPRTQSSGGGNDTRLSIARMSADITNSTTSFSDATGLSFAVEANKTYYITFFIRYRVSIATDGIRLAVNGPASPTLILGRTTIQTNASTASQAHFRAYDTPGVVTTAVEGADTDMLAVMDVIFVNGANAGTLVVRVASEVAATVATIKASSGGIMVEAA